MTYLRRCVLLIIFVSPIGVANTLLDELSICAKKSDSLQRLVCYDKLTKETNNRQPQQHQSTSEVITAKKVDSSVNLAQKSLSEATQAGTKASKKLPTVELQSTDVIDSTIKQQRQEEFGKENIQRSENLVEQISAKVIEIQKAPYGELIITIEGGQVWRQKNRARFKLSEGEVITIERGALGSFFIGKEDTNRRIRVKRMK
jgi:quercetin dioxygenase-like cupin family protein